MEQVPLPLEEALPDQKHPNPGVCPVFRAGIEPKTRCMRSECNRVEGMTKFLEFSAQLDWVDKSDDAINWYIDRGVGVLIVASSSTSSMPIGQRTQSS